MAEPKPKPKSKLKETLINLDEGDENADWIKMVNGGASQETELAIHDELAKKFKPAKEETHDTPKKDPPEA